MPGDPDPPLKQLSLSTDRMVALSDGVFGFAMTLLVLDIAVRRPGPPLEQVLHARPRYVAYVVSFLTIGGTWLLHTVLTERLGIGLPLVAVALYFGIAVYLVVPFREVRRLLVRRS